MLQYPLRPVSSLHTSRTSRTPPTAPYRGPAQTGEPPQRVGLGHGSQRFRFSRVPPRARQVCSGTWCRERAAAAMARYRPLQCPGGPSGARSAHLCCWCGAMTARAHLTSTPKQVRTRHVNAHINIESLLNADWIIRPAADKQNVIYLLLYSP